MTKKLFIKTYGCQMNVYDSERMAGALETSGYEVTEDQSEADMILLNTCHIREKAADKVYSELGRLKPLRTTKPGLKIGVAGCVAQAEGTEIFRRQPMVDLVVGPQAYHRLPEMEARVQKGDRAIDTEFPEEDKFDHLPTARGPKARRSPTAFLTVQEGCDKFCAFCVVPYTRGAEVSRPPERLLAEARDLVDRGVVEVTLLGQNVNAYAADGWTLAKLIREMAKIDGLKRIRFTTSHPNDMSDDLIAAHGEEPKLMPYLHLPVQSGSDKVLKAMNRRHTAEKYLSILEKMRAARPDIALSGDFIVGFPGETDADFDATLALCEEVRYAQAYSFKYSPRPGTPAAGREDVPEHVKSERLAALQEMLTKHQAEFQRAQVGKILPVLLEKPGRLPGQIVGRSPYLQAVHLQAETSDIGRIVHAQIVSSEKNSLAAQQAAATYSVV
ncbi:tRNA (N6-isopentenyl adenosine(37)-C2)-methylthiotransferase MiaB [Algicella marina]|uniref:tRNA-2-methylthio-N(6)-dimethylallyladenosine synthase n=1 Tax=Algicella marina TaxID=2683284 RepID=A0A6P1T4G9_9RHOB|nr:tRNA (N6-isopentenyl adenosine(37)-C2)-methylthiotransferase MiaB [Algicella marina]QHQ36159.1 tRNA (N6-isopentenyl adenosine(37)-C2)-methylthiotransferase MiaB [Algicella marina]